MLILAPVNWQDYELLDSGNGQRLEKYGLYVLIRPDPQCIWKPHLSKTEWNNANAIFARTSADKGVWKKQTRFDREARQAKMPDKWLCKWKNLSFWVKLTPFKHTGIFPEQAIHWEFIQNVILSKNNRHSELVSESSNEKTLKQVQGDKKVNILNLFGYTGIASLAAAKAGAKLTHVDGSYPTIGWARENQKASGLEDKPIRWILDDVMKFCQREVKRGIKYDGIIMDPPVFGHGPTGETWKFENSFPLLMDICRQLLVDKPLFFIVNAYAISASAIMLENVLKDYLGEFGGKIESGELVLQEKDNDRLLSTGIFARLVFD